MPSVDTSDLIDARGVAEVLGLSHSNSVSTYQRRYPGMPRPAVDLGEGRCKLWLASEIRGWATATGRLRESESVIHARHSGSTRREGQTT